MYPAFKRNHNTILKKGLLKHYEYIMDIVMTTKIEKDNTIMALIRTFK